MRVQHYAALVVMFAMWYAHRRGASFVHGILAHRSRGGDHRHRDVGQAGESSLGDDR